MKRAAALMLIALSTNARATADVFEDIEVTGLRNPYRITPPQLREAVAAYNTDRPRLAPRAPLRFEIFGYRVDPALRDVRFRLLADNGDAIPVAIDADGRFALPPADFSKRLYALQANRKVGTVRVRPLILSPGSRDDDQRLGDLRLMCSVGWAMMRQTVSILARAAVGVAGGVCASSRVAIFYRTDRPISGATVSFGPTSKPLTIGRNNESFRLPGYDKTLSDEARITLVYR